MGGCDDAVHGPRGLWGWEFWREVWRAKSPGRILMNFEIRQRVQLSGRVVDLGGGENPSFCIRLQIGCGREGADNRQK